jgi:hypothetical protein
MDIDLKNEPVSTNNPKFSALVDDHFENNELIIVLIRYANSAGAKDYLLVRTKDEFDKLLQQLRSKTSITVFFESAFALKGISNAELRNKTKKLFCEEHEEYEGLDIICTDPKLGEKIERDIMFMQKLEVIDEWLERHHGYQVFIGTMKFWCDNNKDFLTAYVPDDDGVVRPGAY